MEKWGERGRGGEGAIKLGKIQDTVLLQLILLKYMLYSR